MQTFRFLFFMSFTFPVFTPAAQAGSKTVLGAFTFTLQRAQECSSGYAADDLSTKIIESTCASFDLDGLEASAFQAGVSVAEAGTSGELRPFWPLEELVFNTEPRPLPNPAVSPLIYFQFIRDDVCPSGYAGKLLNHPSTEPGCLVFDLDGFHGQATLEANFDSGGEVDWALSDVQLTYEKEGDEELE